MCLCDLPGTVRRSGRDEPPLPFPMWSCSGWGLPCGPAFARTRWALTPPFHPYPPASRKAVRFLWHFPSPEIDTGLPALTTGHPALWSPDFPLCGFPQSDWLPLAHTHSSYSPTSQTRRWNSTAEIFSAPESSNFTWIHAFVFHESLSVAVRLNTGASGLPSRSGVK